MSDGVKLIGGIILILGLVYVGASIFFPEIIRSLNIEPIKINLDVF